MTLKPISTFLHQSKSGALQFFGIFEIYENKVFAAPATNLYRTGWEKPLWYTLNYSIKYNGYYFTIRGKRCYLKQFAYNIGKQGFIHDFAERQ